MRYWDLLKRGAPMARKGQIRKTSRRAFTGLTKRRTGVSKARFMKLEQSKKALSARMRKLKASTTGAAGVGKTTAVTATGGAISGALSVYSPTIAGISTGLIGGSLLVAYAAFADDSKFGGIAAGIGAGMLAVSVADFVADSLTGMEAWGTAPAAVSK